MPTQVNLRPNEQGNVNPVIHWLSTNGKYILLVFNFVLFGLYLYRFQLDRRNILLKESILQTQDELNKLSGDVKKYEELQEIISFVKAENEQDVNATFILDFLNKSTPSGITIQSIKSNGSSIEFNAISNSPSIFSTFLGMMLDEDSFTSVILNSSSYSEDSDSFTFTMQVEY